MIYKKIVVFGGGSGLSNVLEGLKNYPVEIIAVVSVSDNGGSSGKIREELQTIPFGDLRKVMASLVDEPFRKLLNYRMKSLGFKGHPVGNIIMTAFYEMNQHDLVKALRDYTTFLGLEEHVLPVSLVKTDLEAIYADGKMIVGEKEIPKYHARITKIRNIPNDRINEQVLLEIEKADMILYSPGSLYTSLIAVLSYPAVISSISKSKALKVYLSNILTQSYETEGYRLSDHVNALINTIGISNLDIVIANSNYQFDSNLKVEYNRKGNKMVLLDKRNVPKPIKVISKDLIEIKDGHLEHNHFKSGLILFNLLYKEEP